MWSRPQLPFRERSADAVRRRTHTDGAQGLGEAVRQVGRPRRLLALVVRCGQRLELVTASRSAAVDAVGGTIYLKNLRVVERKR